VSWDGPPEPTRGRSRQRFDLTLVDGDLADEVSRLTSIGATVLDGPSVGDVTLADPDGNEFLLRHPDRSGT
jgi:hypothetical protein